MTDVVRLGLAIVTLTVIVTALGGCTPDGSVDDRAGRIPGPEPVRGGRISIGVVGEPATLDPYGDAASDLTYALVAPVFPTPYRLLPDGSTEPNLAADLEVSGRRARLTLAPRSWSSGRAISARDVVHSVRRATAPSGFARLAAARSLSRRVVLLVARRSHPVQDGITGWQELLASGAFVLPRGQLQAGRISGGPFHFAHYQQGRRLVYERNGRWEAGQTAHLEEIEAAFVQSTDLLLRLLADGKLDAAALPSSVNLDDRLGEFGLAFDEARGWESVYLDFADGLTKGEWTAIATRVDRESLLDAFVRDDGVLSNTLHPGPGATEGFWSHVAARRGPPPSEISIAAPEGDELLGLIQRALQLDLEDSGVTSELITAPSSTHYGRWRDEGPADAALIRALGAPGAVTDPMGTSALPIAQVESIVAWRAGIHGLVVNPSLAGPLWNAHEWWREPSI